MKYIDLFAGVGGFRYGIEMATSNIMYDKGGRSEESDSKTRLGFNCVYSNEWDKYANSVYKKHFGECDSRDIRDVKASELPEFDLLCGGFPCQSFSIAGKRGGFSDIRGTLFFEIARIIKQKQPRFLLLENVKGLLSHDQGRTFTTIITTLDELGYDCQWQVLNSKNFGVPQNRERVFIVGHLRGTTRPQVFPILGSNPKNIKVSSDLNWEKWKRFNESSRRVYDTEGVCPTIPTVTGGGHMPKIDVSSLNDVVSCTHGEKSKLDDRALEGKKKLRKKDGNLCDLQEKKENRYPPQKRGLARQQSGEFRGDVSELPLSPTQSNKDLQTRKLSEEKKEVRILRETQSEVQKMGKPPSSKTQPILRGARIRRLTPIETERLQGFPDNWTQFGELYLDEKLMKMRNREISDTQRYRQMGNAVSTPVVSAIIEKLCL